MVDASGSFFVDDFVVVVGVVVTVFFFVGVFFFFFGVVFFGAGGVRVPVWCSSVFMTYSRESENTQTQTYVTCEEAWPRQ